MKDTLAASAALLGHDAAGKNYSMSFSTIPQSTQPSQSETCGNILTAIKQTVLNGEKEAVAPLILKALEQNYKPIEITEQGLTAAMNEIGVAFGSGKCFLPQVLLAAETMRVAFTTIKGAIPSLSAVSNGTVVLATVKGDIHDLGKNIVAALMENSGFRIIDLGKDVSPEKIVETAIKESADIVGLCALMTTTMPQIDSTINELKKHGCLAKTIVGGAVLTGDYAAKAGADAYAANGVDAVNIAKEFCKMK
jgi:5-methyltetrahydrofolate--homocysteine methyltransferase